MQFLTFALTYPFIWILSKLPMRILYIISDVFFFLIYYVFGYRKKVVSANLKLVFPEKSAKELKKIEKEFYGHLCDLFMEMVKTMNLSLEKANIRYNVTNKEYMQALEKEKSLSVC